MLAYNASPDSPWGCELRDRFDDAPQWQAPSMSAREDATPNKQKKLMPLALGLLLGLPGLARADVKFTFITIDVPGAFSTAADANSPNAIAGEFEKPQGTSHGFILSGGAYQTFDAPDTPKVGGFTAINGINAAGQRAGTYMDASGVFHAFFWSQGVFTALNPPDSTPTPTPNPRAIRSQGGFLNSQGQVVGTYRDKFGMEKRHGFVWKGTFINTTINVPGDDDVSGTVAFGINDLGEIVGDYVARRPPSLADGKRHGFLLSQGTYTTFDPPGSILTVGEGINNDGVIVGAYLDASFNQHGFVLTGGVCCTSVDVPGSTATAINSINARGQIVGSYDDSNGVTHGFLGTPVQ
jgi:uncharacterized membrane protein